MAYNDIKNDLTDIQFFTLEMIGKLRDYYKKHGIDKVYDDMTAEYISVDKLGLKELIDKLDENITGNITVPANVGQTLGQSGNFQILENYIKTYATGIDIELDFSEYHNLIPMNYVCDTSLQNISKLKVKNLMMQGYTTGDIFNYIGNRQNLTEVSLINITPSSSYISWDLYSIGNLISLTFGYTLDYSNNRPEINLQAPVIPSSNNLVNLELPNWDNTLINVNTTPENMFCNIPNLSEDSIINILTWISVVNMQIGSQYMNIASFTGFDSNQMDLIQYSTNAKMIYIVDKLRMMGWTV